MTDYDTKAAREYRVVRTGLKPPSSNYSVIRCPFCQTEVRAYWWSIAGGGKKCDCGAKHDQWGNTAPPTGKVLDPVKRKFYKPRKTKNV